MKLYWELREKNGFRNKNVDGAVDGHQIISSQMATKKEFGWTCYN